jgi:hypothetical protein
MAYRQRPWGSDRLGFVMRPEPTGHNDPDRAHPLFAPLAWIGCLLTGAVFWVAVFRFIF